MPSLDAGSKPAITGASAKAKPEQEQRKDGATHQRLTNLSNQRHGANNAYKGHTRPTGGIRKIKPQDSKATDMRKEVLKKTLAARLPQGVQVPASSDAPRATGSSVDTLMSDAPQKDSAVDRMAENMAHMNIKDSS